jgi:hypothetical protein
VKRKADSKIKWPYSLKTFAFFIVLFFLLSVLFVSTPVVFALQEPSLDTSPITPKRKAESSKRGSFVAAPIPISNPAIGSGATVIGAYIFPLRKSDTVSPPSLVGGAWVGTNNGTRAWVAATEMYFNQDHYHVVTGVAHGDLYYDFYGTGTAAGDAGLKFGLNQTGDIFFAEVMRRTFWQVFIGPRMWFGTSKIDPQKLGTNNPDLPPLGMGFKMRSLGLKVERDTTPNRFYPEAGSLLQFGSDFFSKNLGGTYSFQRYRLMFNYYQGIGKNQVLAYNVFLCSTGGDAPFFGECIFGMQDELRGYAAGRYIDRKMIATQAEYRRVLPWRFGVAVFGGLGEVGPKFSKFDLDNILLSGGVGPRFNLSTKYHLNLRADFAWGKNGRTFSMGLGESF